MCRLASLTQQQPNWTVVLLYGFLSLPSQGAEHSLCVGKDYQEALFMRKCFGGIIPSGNCFNEDNLELESCTHIERAW